MSENVQITPGAGVTIGADSVTDGVLGSAQIQYIKIMDGSIGGTNKAGVSTDGLLVDGSGVTQPISATSLPLPAGAATSANQSSEISLLTTIASNTTSSGTPVVSGTVTVVQPTAANLNATVIQDTAADLLTASWLNDGSGNAISSTSGSLDVFVSNFPATQPISGTVTANAGTGTFQTNVTNSSIPVTQSGTWNVTNITGTISLPTGAATEATLSSIKTDTDKFTFVSSRLLVDGSGVTQPISGTVTVNPLTNASVVTVELEDGAGNPITSQVNGSQQALDVGINVAGVQIDPRQIRTLTSSDTVSAVQSGTWTVSLTSGSIEIGTVDQGNPNTLANGWPVVPTDGTHSQSFTAAGEAKVSVTQPLPAGTNVIGHIIADSGSTTVVAGNVTVVQTVGSNLHVDVDNFPATQPISAVSLPLPTGAATSANQTNASQKTQIVDGSGNVIASTSNSLNVNVTNTEPISGTVTSNQGTPNTLANAWPVELSDGTNLLGTSAHPVRIDPTGTTTQPVSGTVAATQSGAWNITNISGTITLPTGASTAAKQPALGTAGTASSDVITVQGISGMTALKVDGSAVTQPVSGTVTANAGTGNFTVVQATGTNLHTVLDSGTLTSITNALPAGTNVIGHVITDSGSTTAVTGNVTVVQGTGTNLHTVVDSGSVTVANASIAVTQSTSPWVVSLASTTITGTVTAVGNLTHNNAAPTANNIGVLSAVASTAAPTYTTGDQVLLSTDLSGNLRVVIDGTITEQNVNLNQVGGSAIAIGQAAMAASLPVVIASNQSSIPVTLTSTTITGTVAVTQSTSPWVVSGTVTTTPPANASTNITQWDSVALGAPSAYGTSPGAVNVIGVNAFITNTPTVTANAGTGTFAISAASLPLPTGAATSTNQTNGSQKSQIVDNADVSWGPAITLSGTNFMPVYLASSGVNGNANPTGTVQIGGSDGTDLRTFKVSATGVLSVDGSAVTQPVSGTVTVSQSTASNLNATVAQGTPASATNKWPVCITDSGGVNQAAVNGSGQLEVVAPTITKGTQAATGFTTQDLKDSGRTYVTFTADAVAGTTTETLLTMTQNRQGTTTSANNYTITNGKTLRVQSIAVAIQAGSAAPEWVRLKLRHNTAGATTTSSSLVVTVACGDASSVTADSNQVNLAIPDGLEFYGNGTQTIGFSHISSNTTNVESITIIGYEY